MIFVYLNTCWPRELYIEFTQFSKQTYNRQPPRLFIPIVFHNRRRADDFDRQFFVSRRCPKLFYKQTWVLFFQRKIMKRINKKIKTRTLTVPIMYVLKTNIPVKYVFLICRKNKIFSIYYS